MKLIKIWFEFACQFFLDLSKFYPVLLFKIRVKSQNSHNSKANLQVQFDLFTANLTQLTGLHRPGANAPFIFRKESHSLKIMAKSTFHFKIEARMPNSLFFSFSPRLRFFMARLLVRGLLGRPPQSSALAPGQVGARPCAACCPHLHRALLRRPLLAYALLGRAELSHAPGASCPPPAQHGAITRAATSQAAEAALPRTCATCCSPFARPSHGSPRPTSAPAVTEPPPGPAPVPVAPPPTPALTGSKWVGMVRPNHKVYGGLEQIYL